MCICTCTCARASMHKYATRTCTCMHMHACPCSLRPVACAVRCVPCPVPCFLRLALYAVCAACHAPVPLGVRWCALCTCMTIDLRPSCALLAPLCPDAMRDVLCALSPCLIDLTRCLARSCGMTQAATVCVRPTLLAMAAH